MILLLLFLLLIGIVGGLIIFGPIIACVAIIALMVWLIVKFVRWLFII